MCFSVVAPRQVLDPLPPHLRKPPAQQGELRTCGAVKFHIDFRFHPSFCQQELAFEYSSDFSFRLLLVGSCTPGLTIAPGFAPEGAQTVKVLRWQGCHLSPASEGMRPLLSAALAQACLVVALLTTDRILRRLILLQ